MSEDGFTPVRPPRAASVTPAWRSLFNEHSRNAVAGWSELAFREWHTRRNVLGTIVHIPRHPDAIERVLLSNAANYEKPRIVKRVIAPLIGRGLVSSDGELWRTQRRIVAPSFSPGAVTRLMATMAEAAAATDVDWPAEGTIDIARAATDTTMRIIAEALFSGDPRLTSAEAARHIENALLAAGSVRISALLGLPTLPLSAKIRAGNRGRRYLRATLGAIVRERGPQGGDDFLGGVIRGLHAEFPAREAVELAIDNAATFYVAGHETTANTLTWNIYLLANAPDVQERAAAEARSALVGDPATLAERLPYLRQVIDEAMRLYPPAPRFDREAMADDELNGVAVAKGDIVSIWPWLIHRHEGLWDRPDAFDPDRFAPGSEGTRHRFQYLPFGGGPRTCVGARFATVEALVILARWLAGWRFAPVPSEIVRPLGSVTLRPLGGLRVDVARRC